jgi:hypothetical protein
MASSSSIFVEIQVTGYLQADGWADRTDLHQAFCNFVLKRMEVNWKMET